MRLEEFFQKYARQRGVGMADALAKELRTVLSVQAPTRITRGGKVVAATPATPFAPPRRVTGKLQSSVKVHRTAHGARVVIYAPYAYPLEKSKKWYGWPHEFLSVALENLGLGGRHARQGGAPQPKKHKASWRQKIASWFKRFTGRR